MAYPTKLLDKSIRVKHQAQWKFPSLTSAKAIMVLGQAAGCRSNLLIFSISIADGRANVEGSYVSFSRLFIYEMFI